MAEEASASPVLVFLISVYAILMETVREFTKPASG